MTSLLVLSLPLNTNYFRRQMGGGGYTTDSSFAKPFNSPDELDLPSASEQISVDLSEKPHTFTEYGRPKRVIRLPNKLKDDIVEKTTK
jgi:hypothetical protein